MRYLLACLALAIGAAPAFAELPAGSVWLPTLGMSVPGVPAPAGTIPMHPGRPLLAPSLDRPVAQPGQFPTAPAANNPVDQQKRAFYQSQLRGYQRDLANQPGPLTPGTAQNAFTAQQELNRLRIQTPSR